MDTPRIHTVLDVYFIAGFESIHWLRVATFMDVYLHNTLIFWQRVWTAVQFRIEY